MRFQVWFWTVRQGRCMCGLLCWHLQHRWGSYRMYPVRREHLFWAKSIRVYTLWWYLHFHSGKLEGVRPTPRLTFVLTRRDPLRVFYTAKLARLSTMAIAPTARLASSALYKTLSRAMIAKRANTRKQDRIIVPLVLMATRRPR